MQIHALCIRRYRSIKCASLRECGGLNVLIGKNNSGKSNLLSAIDLVQRHLGQGSIAAPMGSPRPLDEFTDRIAAQPLQIGVEFTLPAFANDELRKALEADAPHLEKSIEQIRQHSRLSIIVSGVFRPEEAFLFVQSIGAGRIDDSGELLRIDGIPLLEVPVRVAHELYAFQREQSDLRNDVQTIDRLLEEPYRIDMMLSSDDARYLIPGRDMRPGLARAIGALARKKPSKDDFIGSLQGMQSDARTKILAIQHRDTEEAMAAFAGATKAPPKYALDLLTFYGNLNVLHLRETRDAVGRDEAEALLTLKVTRGGPDRLTTVQNTIKSLLGVTVDAFQADGARRGSSRSAEIDVDQFLVEANGAGVREALRLVLDFELKQPALVLIEEPEVHLHPGLEHAVYQYLRDKSQSVQVFVTTHSTSFVDSVSFQNIYLVSKGSDGKTSTKTLDSGDGALQIPAELGLRLSTVFMFDRLIFVEGPSDEAVFRELCKTLDFDLASRNVGFVQMGGVRNFAHFAAQSTLELLSRRQVAMWFIADRDERDDADVTRMLRMLGDRAKLHVLARRELENYLFCDDAIVQLIELKASGSQANGRLEVTRQAVADALEIEAKALQHEVVRLRLTKKLLGPVHLMGRDFEGDIDARLTAGISQLQARHAAVLATQAEITDEIDRDWDNVALQKAPGSVVLMNVMRRFGYAFSKEGGDSARLARFVPKRFIPQELTDLLSEIATS